MNKSDSISNLAAALAKAQPKIEGASKDKTNPHFKSKYADLASVAEAIAAPLAVNGLSYVQTSHDRENAAAIETIILHTSGEWLGCGVVSVPVSKGDAQGFGSALTYARRYSLSAAFGVVPEDDDGNAAAKAKPMTHAAMRPGDGNGHITPTTGYWEKQPIDVQNELLDLAHRASKLIKRNDLRGAYDEIDQAAILKHSDGADDHDKIGAFWTRMESSERAALKREGQARATKAA